MIIRTDPEGEKFHVFQLGETMEQAKREIFELVLENNGGNITHTARALGVSMRTVRNWRAKKGWGRAPNHDTEEDCIP